MTRQAGIYFLFEATKWIGVICLFASVCVQPIKVSGAGFITRSQIMYACMYNYSLAVHACRLLF